MKTDITSISIPQPCHEKWNEMTPATEGRFCGSCAKTVIDFTKMSDEHIISYLSKSVNVCGRFYQDQLYGLDTYRVERRPPFNWKAMVLTACLFISVPCTRVLAQPGPKLNTVQRSEERKKISPNYRTISGTVRDNADNRILPGATIMVKGHGIFTVADLNGVFDLSMPVSADTLIINYGGYCPFKFAITPDINWVDITLQQSHVPSVVGYAIRSRTTTTGAITIVLPQKRQPFFIRWFYRYIVEPVKHIFGSTDS